MTLKFTNKQNKEVTLLKNTCELGQLVYRITQNHKTHYARNLIIKENIIKAEFDEAVVLDEFREEQEHICVKRSWTIKKAGKWQFSFLFIPALGDLQEWIVPAVLYQENQHGIGKYPRGTVRDGWSFREDRSSIPSCSIYFDRTQYFSLYTKAARREQDISSIKSFIFRGKPSFEILIPFSELPKSFREKGIYLGGLSRAIKTSFHIKSFQLPYQYEREFFIVHRTIDSQLDGLRHLYSHIWEEHIKSPPDLSIIDWSSVASLKLHHLQYLLIDKPNIAAIKMGDGNGWYQSFYEHTAGSFLTKSIEAATLFARAGIELNNDEFLEKAEKIGEFFLQGRLPNGLHQDWYQLKTEKWGGYLGVGTNEHYANGVNTRCNGEVMYNYIRLYKLLKQRNRNHDNFLNLCEKNADFYLKNQLKDEHEGSFGRWWTQDGKPFNASGTNGAHIITLLIELESVIGRQKEIEEALRKAFVFYRGLLDRQAFYGDTLDADCIDKEAGVALLGAFLKLYEREAEPQFLRAAQRSADFILSWIWTYNVPFDDNTLCGKRKVQTRGLTSVSVDHQVLDFYGLLIGYLFLKLWRASKQEIWRRYGLLMIQPCSQLIADQNDPLEKSPELIGYQPEQINQTTWDYHHRWIGTKGRFHTNIAWTTVLTLGALFDIREDFPDILNFQLTLI